MRVRPFRRLAGLLSRATTRRTAPNAERLRPRRRGVRWRSVVVAVATTGIALAVGGLVLVLLLRQQATDTVAQATLQRAQQVAAQLSNEDVPNDEGWPDWSGGDGVARIIDTNGQTLAASRGAESLALPPLRLAGGQVAQLRVTPQGDDVPWWISAIGARSGGHDYTVIAAMSLGQTEDTVNAAAVLLATGFPILLLIVGSITYWLTGRALAPVEAIRNEVAEVSQADLARRVPVPGSRDEIAGLAETMNSMLARLETAQTTQRRFISDASHELRSPLATLRASIEIADRQDLDANQLNIMRDEIDRMVRVVDDLLLLTRAHEHRLQLHRSEVDLDDLVNAERARLAQTTELTVHARLHPVKVYADPAALSRAIRNLVDNAARHANTTVDLSVTYGTTHAVLEVTDDGPGIPEADRQRVFERFVRLDTARQRSSGGAGLGLAIVHEIITAHDGDVRIADAPAGRTCFQLRIPLPPRGMSQST